MAARNRKGLSENTRLRIKTTMLVKRLADYALGVEGVEMSQGQITAALGLLRKTLPDLKGYEGQIDHTHQHTHESVSESAEWVSGMLGTEQDKSAKKPVSH